MNKLLRPLGGLTFFNRERPFRCFSSIDLVVFPGHRRRHMGTTVTHPRPRESAGSAAAADPASVMLDRWGCLRGSSANVVTDNNTVAESRTSRGQPLRVALARAPPPAISFICFDRGEDGGGSKLDGNSVSTHVMTTSAAVDQPPSLSLLPVCDIPMNKRCWRNKDRFKDKFTTTDRNGSDGEEAAPLVAQLQIAHEPPFDTAELCLLRPGQREWELKTAVPIVVHHDGGGERRHGLEMWQETNVAVPVGDRFMCWANYDLSTFLFCDMATAADHPKLLYVPLPVKPVPPKESDFDDNYHDELIPWEYFRNIVAGADGDHIVRFVSIDNRCCCGAPVIRSLCERSSSAFMVTMWSLALRNAGDGESDGEPMAWVKEAVLDCEELWAMLAPCKGLPRRVYVVCPFVSSENPDVVWFVARSDDIDDDEDGKIWTLEIDVRRKTLISVVPLSRHPHGYLNYGKPLPAKLHGC
uniref:DUF1618 domain-containing protein n=1 Tax=Oryza punctata TaxID=4537 RepID=A0A0E0MGG0_ORYPU